MNIRQACAQIVDALTAAGLDARFVADPDRGAGVVVDVASWDFAGRRPRSGCGDLTPADLETTVTVIGAGWAVEQVEQFCTDIDTARDAIPAPWSPDRGTGDFSPDAPLYRITCAR